VLPARPRLSIVPRPVSTRVRVNAALSALPATVVAAAGLVVIQTVAFVAGRVLAVNLVYDRFIDSTETARLLGAVSFLSIVVIAAAIALGHRGLRSIPDSERLSRQVTAIVLGAAYLHLVLWVTRVLAASVAASSVQSSALLMPNVFWWG
jgi:hypothetical protein